MRDEHYRKLCDSPTEYDAVIDWIATNNDTAERSGNAEEFACTVVHSCIRTIVFGTCGSSFCSTGMAIAVRLSMDPQRAGYKKVVLAVTLLSLARKVQA